MQNQNDSTLPPVLLLYNLDETWEPEAIEEVLQESTLLETGMTEVGHEVTAVRVNTQDLTAHLRDYSPDQHIVLNWCEGLPGLPHSWADVADTLESMRFVYTGSTGAVLALSDDKHAVKRILDEQQVPTPQWRIYEPGTADGWNCFPAIVKPAEEHCSLGVTSEAVVGTPEELRHRIEYVFDTFHEAALVEDFIDGREFHVSLWGNGTIEVLPVAEMDFSAFNDLHDRLCTWDAKFNPESRHYKQIELRLPAPLSDAEQQELERVSVAAYRAIGCRDYARLDVRLRDGVFYVLDVNANADISSSASLACAAQARGYSYGAMGSHLVHLAALRSPRFAARARAYRAAQPARGRSSASMP